MVARQTEFASTNLMEILLSDLENTALPMYEKTLASENLDPKRKSLCSYSRLGTQLELISVKYTLGHDLKALEADCRKIPEFLEYHLDSRVRPLDVGIGSYSIIVSTLSLCYLLSIDLSDRVLDRIPFSGQDMLIDRLVHCFRRSIQPTQKILFPKLYAPLLEALGQYGQDKRDGLFRVFIEQYFSGLEYYDASWCGSHKEEDPNRFYHFGYWVFELGALIVDIDWDDSEFRDHPIYPIDLVDWKRSTLAD